MGNVKFITDIWTDGGGYVGMEFYNNGKLLEYWIGMFAPMTMNVPDGFETMDFALDKGSIVSFENGLCPRYTTPDEKGNIFLDYCYFVK